MNLNFDYQFDVYKFHEVGFNVGILPTEFITEAKKIIKSTTFNTNASQPYMASWMSISDDFFLKNTNFGYEENLKDLYCYNTAPYYIKNIFNEVLSLDFFTPLRKSLVKIQSSNTYWTRSIRPFTYGLWNGTENIEWHNDNYDNSYMVLLMYFNDYEEWKIEWDGHIIFGLEQEDKSIKEIHKHYPTDGTFVCINSYNPLMRHKVISNKNNTNRYTFNAKCRIH
jgi:hypothetical protein